MAKSPRKLDELFHDTLKDIYYAERKILAALPKMVKAARNEDLDRCARGSSIGRRQYRRRGTAYGSGIERAPTRARVTRHG